MRSLQQIWLGPGLGDGGKPRKVEVGILGMAWQECTIVGPGLGKGLAATVYWVENLYLGGFQLKCFKVFFGLFLPSNHLFLDVKLGHMYQSANGSHPRLLKPTAISSMETSKRTKYQQAYRDKGFAFAPAVCNTWGELGPDLLRFLWAVAEFSARNQIGLPDLGPRPPPSQSLADQSVHARQENAFKILRGCLFHAYRQRMLWIILEGVTERVFGRTQCLTSNRHYQRWQRMAREPWQQVLSNLPADPPAPSPVPVRSAVCDVARQCT